MHREMGKTSSPDDDGLDLEGNCISARLTCDFSFAHATPDRFGLAQRPVLDLCGEAAKELVLLQCGRHAARHSFELRADESVVRGRTMSQTRVRLPPTRKCADT